ncbi:MAG: patatin [Acidobacteria bacterium]|nr:patatin [Acidobacteriota bacterium]
MTLDSTAVPPCEPRPPAGIDLSRPQLGLALSGGGFRAAAFHIGTLDALEELGLLDKVSNLSTVSGGSITGVSWLHYRVKHPADSYAQFRSWFRDKLCSVNVDVKDVLVGLIDPFHTDTDYLVHSYRKHFFGDDTLSVLNNPALPRICINATCLNTGKDWKFYPDVMGDWYFCQKRPGVTWQERFYSSGDVPLAVAVAASSCFPPVFAPLILPSKQYFPDQAARIPYIALADGGMYDNLGLDALTYGSLHGDRCTHLIASDGSGPFHVDPKPGTGQTVYLTRTTEIMMTKIRAFEFQIVQLQAQAFGVPRAAFFSLNSKLRSEPNSLIAACDIPTRLKALSDAQFNALATHAKNLALARVQQFLLAAPAETGAEHFVTAPDGEPERLAR